MINSAIRITANFHHCLGQCIQLDLKVRQVSSDEPAIYGTRPIVPQPDLLDRPGHPDASIRNRLDLVTMNHMPPSIYVETTVPSYLTAWPSRDLLRAAHQEVTRDWWARRGEYQLFSSRLVVEECRAGDPQAATDRLIMLADMVILEQTERSAALARAIIRHVSLPKRAAADALHIAIAAVHEIEYLLTWNCTHIANPAFRRRIDATCIDFGHQPPLICTPYELLGMEDGYDRG